VIIGIGLGIMSSTVPVWQSESSKTHKRGVHVIIDGVYIALGIAVCAWTTYGFWKADTQSGWKWRIPGYVHVHCMGGTRSSITRHRLMSTVYSWSGHSG
jgi:hypothetical protein